MNQDNIEPPANLRGSQNSREGMQPQVVEQACPFPPAFARHRDPKDADAILIGLRKPTEE